MARWGSGCAPPCLLPTTPNPIFSLSLLHVHQNKPCSWHVSHLNGSMNVRPVTFPLFFFFKFMNNDKNAVRLVLAGLT